MSSGSIVSRESRWLRLGGIALVVASPIALAVLEHFFELRQVLGTASRSPLLVVAALAVGLANLFALGLVILLAGLRQMSLVHSARARRAALTRMIALNLLLLCFVVAAIVDADALGEEIYTEWYAWVALVAFVVVARGGIVLFRSGWKYEARRADEVLASDPRPPVVYLRSFSVDHQILVPGHGAGARLARPLMYTASVSPEQEMAFVLDRIGPVVAIGKPAERLPELGAARLYVADDEWRAVVAGLMRDAALVVIRAGETENLWWEITEALTRCPRDRVLIVALGPPESFATFTRRFAEAFGNPAAPPAPPRSGLLGACLRLLFPYGQSTGKIIYFDRHGLPQQEILWYRLTWSGAILAPYRPHRDSLQAALTAVFAKLGLAGTPRRSQTSAVLLALFGGILGLHHFYMGRRRRGMWYVAFSWLIVPMLLGWADAVRLAWLDDTRFQAQLLKSGSSEPPGRR